MSLFDKIATPARIYQEIADQIEKAILEKELKPGQRLPSERELADIFAVNRRTLREALRLLGERGLVEIERTGSRVKMAGTQKLSEDLSRLLRFNKIPVKALLEFRKAVDYEATRLAVTRATKKDVDRLLDMVRQGEEYLKEKPMDWKKIVSLDLKVHLAVARIAKNPLFEWVLHIILDNLLKFYEVTVVEPDRFALNSFKDIKELVAAFEEKDLEKALSVMKRHIEVRSHEYLSVTDAGEFSLNPPDELYEAFSKIWEEH